MWRKPQNTSTLPSTHNTSVLEKTTKLLTPHPVTFIYQDITTSYAYKTGTAQSQQITLLQSYLHTVNPDTEMPQCSLYLSHTHDTNHLFNCSQVPTQHNATSL